MCPVHKGSIGVAVGNKICIGCQVWVRGGWGAVNDEGVERSGLSGLHEILVSAGRDAIRSGDTNRGAYIFCYDFTWGEVPIRDEGTHAGIVDSNEGGAGLAVTRGIVLRSVRVV